MSISSSDRDVMQRELRRVLGDEVTRTLMEHLPPDGWSDVAKTRDVERLEGRVEQIEGRIERLEGRIERLEGRIEQLESRVGRLEGRIERIEVRLDFVERRLELLDGRMKLMISTMIAVSVGLFAMMAQLMFSVSNL